MPLPICSFEQYQKDYPAASLDAYSAERSKVLEIINTVRQNGDTALFNYTEKFDQVRLRQLKVSKEELEKAHNNVEPYLLEAIREAKTNIVRFHRRQLDNNWWDSGSGWIVGQRAIPLQKAGAYIPGGTAAYPSSVLMTVIPARVAGVPEVYLCTPPDSSGKVNSLTLAAAREAGATAVYKVGGAQAVAAMAYGTETIPAVQKIVGPGNIFVTLAKREVYGQVGIDMLAGPSEIVIVAEKEANPVYIAADLLSQAEHDPLSRSILVTPSEMLAKTVIEKLEEQLETLPRKEVALAALTEKGAIIMVPELEYAWPVVNELSPEHLELHLNDAWQYLDHIKNAGAIFVGQYTPEPVGDYWAGSNHVLPTGAAARYASALGVTDFLKKTHVISYSASALQQSADQIAALARAEGLEAHARAVLLRRQDDDQKSKS
ncbi:MAG: histidinol dehydrogenase [Bacillota bacterium]